MRRVFAWDTENWQADGSGHKRGDFRLGVIIDDLGGRHVYHTAPAMAGAFYRRDWEGAWFFAHNVAYDIQNVWGQKIPGRTCLMGGAVYFCRLVTRAWRGKNRKWVRKYVHLADTTRYALKSLAKIGADLAKMTGREDLKKIHDETDDLDALSPDAILERCERDARIVHYFARDILQPTLNELGTSLNYTIGSASLELWRRRCQQRSYIKLDDAELSFLNQAYYGGRTEAFFRGRLPHGTYWLGDFNSMYPSVMRDLEMPIASREHTRRVKDPGLWVLERPGVSLATVRVPDMMYPPLPFREPGTGKLIFPVGRLRGYWTHLELVYAVSVGCVIEDIREAVYFTASERPYQGLMEELFAVRQRGGVYDFVGKLLANNLYGKSGQCRPPGELMSPEEFAQLRQEAADDYERGDDTLARATANPEEYRDRDGRLLAVMLRASGKSYPKHANQIWAAMVTAAARIKLHGALVTYDALYCDTDSVLTATPFEPSNELGGLGFKQQVLSTHDSIDWRTGEILDAALDSRIFGPKAYQFCHYRPDWTVRRVKGVPPKRGWYRTPDSPTWRETSDIRALAVQGFEVGYDAPLKLLESFRKRDLPIISPAIGAPGEFVVKHRIPAKSNAWYFHSKFLKLENTKREALPSGWTRPLRVGNQDDMC